MRGAWVPLAWGAVHFGFGLPGVWAAMTADKGLRGLLMLRRRRRLRGGFPQTAQVESITQAQRMLREDIIDKGLKRDMTALFGARRVLRFKIHLADAAIAPAVLLKGKAFLDDAAALGVATETAVFKHLFARHYPHNVRFSYWRGRKDHEVDLVAEPEGSLVPFEVKYRAQLTGVRELKGLVELCETKRITRGYVVTKSAADLGLLPGLGKATDTGGNPIPQIMRVPAPLLCFWMGATEHLENSART